MAARPTRERAGAAAPERGPRATITSLPPTSSISCCCNRGCRSGFPARRSSRGARDAGFVVGVGVWPAALAVAVFRLGRLALPLLALNSWRSGGGRRSGAFPVALDIVTRSLRAGHPMPGDRPAHARNAGPDRQRVRPGRRRGDLRRRTSRRDAEHALRVGIDDLRLFVVRRSIQSETGGNLAEILENLSKVIRDRFKMRRKIRSLASEARASALILSSLPIAMFAIIYFLVPASTAASGRRI